MSYVQTRTFDPYHSCDIRLLLPLSVSIHMGGGKTRGKKVFSDGGHRRLMVYVGGNGEHTRVGYHHWDAFFFSFWFSLLPAFACFRCSVHRILNTENTVVD